MAEMNLKCSLKGRHLLQDLGIDGGIIIKWILKEGCEDVA
jgi:hypothetical protein